VEQKVWPTYASDLVRGSPPPQRKSQLRLTTSVSGWTINEVPLTLYGKGVQQKKVSCVLYWVKSRSEAHYHTRFVSETDESRTIWTSLVLCVLWGVCNRELASELAVPLAVSLPCRLCVKGIASSVRLCLWRTHTYTCMPRYKMPRSVH